MLLRYSISETPIRDIKPQGDEWGKITFRNVATSMSEMFSNILSGKLVAYNFKDERGEIMSVLTSKDRNTSNFHSTDFMMFDFDDVSVEPKQAIKELNENGIYPAFVYTTLNHKLKGVAPYNNRYRICITLDNTISTPTDYRHVYRLFCEKFKNINPELKCDLQCSDCPRAFSGTKVTEDSYNKFFIDFKAYWTKSLKREFAHILPEEVSIIKRTSFNTGDFASCFNDQELKICCLGDGGAVKNIDISNEEERIAFNRRFASKFISRHTPVRYDYSNIDNNEFMVIKDPYYEVQFAYGDLQLRDGMRRRKQLWHWACTRRLIKPDATFDEVLVSIILDATLKISFDAEKPASNKNNINTKQELLTIYDFMEQTKEAFCHTVEELRKHKNLKPKFQKIMPVGYGEIKLKQGWQKRIQTLLTQKIADELKYKGQLNLFNLNCELVNNGLKQITQETYRKKYQPKQVKKDKSKTTKVPKPKKEKKSDLVAKYFSPNITAYRCYQNMLGAGVKISQTMVKNYYREQRKKNIKVV